SSGDDGDRTERHDAQVGSDQPAVDHVLDETRDGELHGGPDEQRHIGNGHPSPVGPQIRQNALENSHERSHAPAKVTSANYITGARMATLIALRALESDRLEDSARWAPSVLEEDDLIKEMLTEPRTERTIGTYSEMVQSGHWPRGSGRGRGARFPGTDRQVVAGRLQQPVPAHVSPLSPGDPTAHD